MIVWIILAGLALAAVSLMINHEAGAVLGLPNADFAQIAMLAALIVVIGSGLSGRLAGRTGAAVKMAATWLAVGAGLLVAYSYRDDAARIYERVAAELTPGRTVTTEGGGVAVARSGNGHFVVDALVNGAPLSLLLDTGASTVVLTPQDARSAGLDVSSLAYTAQVWTANGKTTAAPVILSRITVGTIEVERVRAVVAHEGALRESLLGMSFLDRISSWRVVRDRLIFGG